MKADVPRLVPADAELNGLQDLFWDSQSPTFVVDAFRQQLGPPDISSDGSIIHVRYRPNRSCTIAWSFPVALHRSVVVLGSLYASDRGERIIADAAFQERAAQLKHILDTDQEPYVYLPERKLLLELAPLDSDLPGLITACSPAFMRGLGEIVDGSDLDVGAEARIISYKPGRRCVLEYSWSDDGRRRRVFGKVLVDGMSGETVSWLQRATDQLKDRGLGWLIVPPIAYVPEAGIVLFRSIDGGDPPKRLLRRARYEPRYKALVFEQLHRAAEGLGAFQRLDGGGLPDVTADDVLRALRSEIESIRLVAQTLAGALDERVEQLTAVLSELESEPAVPCHGAYRFGQMLASASELHVLDFDAVCLASPSSDAANLLAYLDKMALRRPKLGPLITECQILFQDAALASSAASKDWLAWYRAASQLKIAVRSFHGLLPRWPSISRRMLELSEEQLNSISVTVAMA